MQWFTKDDWFQAKVWFRLLVPHQGPALDLLGRGAYSALQTPCWIVHVFGVRKGFRSFTSSIWNTKTVVWQSAWKNHWMLIFLIISAIKMKFGPWLMCCMTNISTMFLAQCWSLETSSRHFYYFIKMLI